jgi:hypothetical protein
MVQSAQRSKARKLRHIMQLEEEVQSLQGLNQQQQGEIAALQQEIALVCARPPASLPSSSTKFWQPFLHANMLAANCCEMPHKEQRVVQGDVLFWQEGCAEVGGAVCTAATANRQLGLQMGEVQEQLRSYEMFTELLIQVRMRYHWPTPARPLIISTASLS